jgi:hypothetical protein
MNTDNSYRLNDLLPRALQETHYVLPRAHLMRDFLGQYIGKDLGVTWGSESAEKKETERQQLNSHFDQQDVQFQVEYVKYLSDIWAHMISGGYINCLPIFEDGEMPRVEIEIILAELVNGLARIATKIESFSEIKITIYELMQNPPVRQLLHIYMLALQENVSYNDVYSLKDRLHLGQMLPVIAAGLLRSR